MLSAMFFGAVEFRIKTTHVLNDISISKEEEEYTTWFKTCKHVLLDLGANRGDTILRWFTEKSYSGRSRKSEVDLLYSLEQRRKFCVLSFEPNDHFSSELQKIEKDMNHMGFRTLAKVNTAVSDKFGRAVIYIDDVSTNAFGTSLIPDKKVNFGGKLHSLGNKQAVKLVDLTAILNSIRRDVELVVKMDIEGGEYDVLRSIVPSGAACSMDVLIIEWHAHKLKKGAVPSGINDAFEWILQGNLCKVRVIHDD